MNATIISESKLPNCPPVARDRWMAPMNPAQALQAHLATLLHLAPHGAQAAVAALLGESGTAWGRYVRGEVQPSADRIARWAKAAEVVIAVDANGWAITA